MQTDRANATAATLREVATWGLTSAATRALRQGGIGVVTSAEDTQPEPAIDAAGSVAPDRAVQLHTVFALLFLLVGSALLIVAYGGIAWPGLLADSSYSEYLNYGRALPMALNLLVFGWLTFGLFAATYYFVPRLLGVRLGMPIIATVNAFVMAGGVIAGVVAIGSGSGAGGRLLEMPWYSDLALAASFLTAAVVVTATVKRSGLDRTGVPVWYFIAAPWWLFLSYTTGAIPGLSGAPAELQSAFTATAVFGMWIAAAAVGGGYALIASRIPDAEFHPRLGRIGFWSLGFLWAWTAGRTLQYGPMGDWMETVPVLFTAALVVAVLTIAADFALAIRGRLDSMRQSLPLQLYAAGTALFVLIPGHMFLQSLRSSSTVVRFSGWESAFDLLAVTGAFSLWTAALVAQILGSMSGRTWGRLWGLPIVTLMAGGVLFAVGTRWVAGLQQGYTWLAGVETGAYANTGDGFFNTVAPLEGTDVLTFIGVAVAAAGALAFVVGTVLRFGRLPGKGGGWSIAGFKWPDHERPVVVRRGAAWLFALAVLAVFVFPAIDADREPTLLADQSRSYAEDSAESQGRGLYIAEGCWYCHTQQVRPIVTDVGLGAVSATGDYAHDPAGTLGVARLGPDLAHAGSRSPTDDPEWVRAHLVDPRAVRPWSTMPAYEHLSDSDLIALAAYVAGLE